MGSLAAIVDAPRQPLPKIWIVQAGKEPPEWVFPAMTGEQASDGSFNIENDEGTTRAIAGNAVFEVSGHVYTCPTKELKDRVADMAARAGEPVIVTARPETQRAPHISEPRKVDLKYKPALGTEPAVQLIRLENLKTDPAYQRMTDNGPSQALIKKIAVNWDWRLCIPLLVSRRENGGLYIIDGQHRWEGAKLRGDPDVFALPCAIFEFESGAQEAELFRQANKVRRAISRLDDFHAAIAAEDDDALAVRDLIEGAGLTIARQQTHAHIKPGEVVFVATIATNLRKHGQQVCHAALSMMARAFEGQKFVAGTPIFQSLRELLIEGQNAGKPLDQELMVTVLREVGLEELNNIVKAASRFERTSSLLDSLREAYGEAEGE